MTALYLCISIFSPLLIFSRSRIFLPLSFVFLNRTFPPYFEQSLFCACQNLFLHPSSSSLCLLIHFPLIFCFCLSLWSNFFSYYGAFSIHSSCLPFHISFRFCSLSVHFSIHLFAAAHLCCCEFLPNLALTLQMAKCFKACTASWIGLIWINKSWSSLQAHLVIVHIERVLVEKDAMAAKVRTGTERWGTATGVLLRLLLHY